MASSFHPEVSFAAMDFWYNIMSSHFRQLAEEDDILGNFDVRPARRMNVHVAAACLV